MYETCMRLVMTFAAENKVLSNCGRFALTEDKSPTFCLDFCSQPQVY